MDKTRDLCQIAILAAMITVLGSIKLPNVIPGVEFQISAPLAVAVCAVFGFKKYIISGCLSSAVCLILGTQNPLNVAIAMQFRLIVGLILYLCKNHLYAVMLSGPIASLIARLTLFAFFGKFAFSMILFAVPGMIFTALASPVLVKVFRKSVQAVPYFNHAK